jgi:hypothetical protein
VRKAARFEVKIENIFKLACKTFFKNSAKLAELFCISCILYIERKNFKERKKKMKSKNSWQESA